MAKLIRPVVAVVVGVILAFVLVVGVEVFSAVVYPPPAEFDGSAEQLHQHVADYPQWVLAICALMWVIIAWISTLVTIRIGGRVAGIIVGLFLVCMVALNISMLPYVMWFEIGMVPAILVAVAIPILRCGRTPQDKKPV